MKKKLIAVVGVVLLILLVSILAPRILTSVEQTRKENLVVEVLQTKFDQYYEGSKFVNEKLVDVLLEYKHCAPSEFDFNTACNEDCTGYDQIVEEYDTENYDYVCVYIQTKQYDVVDYANIIYFSIDKRTNKIVPFGIASSENNFLLEYVGEPDRVIGFAYGFIELMIKYN